MKNYLTLALICITILFCTTLRGNDSFDLITGTVVDELSEPLIGATVSVKGTTRGTITDIDGSFSIDADVGDVLIFSFTGYATQEFEIAGQSSIDIVMANDPLLLSEIVVTGYGTTKKENLTGAVGVVGAKELAARPLTSASQSLQGKVSGLWINQNSGEPGEDGATIRIRGIGTLNNSDPLILIDGIEAPFDNVNPNDIESVTVLKDAASAAIYGSRAANGVVLVTTKRGGRNEAPSVSYTGYFGAQSATNLPNMVTNSAQFMELRNQADINDGSPARYSQAQIDEYRSIGPNTDWLEEAFGTAGIQRHDVSVSGGSDKTNYLVSFGYQDQNSILANVDGAKRYNGRINFDTEISNNLTIGSSVSFSRDDKNLDNINQDGGVLARTIRQTPNYPAFLDNGSFAQREAGFPELITPNILAEIASETRDEVQNRFLGSFYAEYELLPSLKLRGTFAANYQAFDLTQFNRAIDQFDWRSQALLVTENSNRSLTNSFDKRLNLTSWFQATYEKSVGLNNFKFLGGFNQESFDRDFFQTARTELPSNNLAAFATGNPQTATNSNTDPLGFGPSEWALRSFFARINYNYDGKYLAEFNFRRDGSSRFAEDNRWSTFPSISLGWVVSREDFLKSSNIDFLKLRLSYGLLGNQNINNDFPYQALISFDPAYNFGGSIVGGAAQVSLANPTIQWETTKQFDIGFNLGLSQGRLSMEWDYFIRTTSDILFAQSNPAPTGVRTPTFRNIAEVQNKGWETLINWGDEVGDFSYSVGLNITNVNSEVLQIDPEASGDADRVFQGNFILQRGSPINAIYGLEVQGIFQSDGEVDSAPDQSLFGAAGAGDLRFVDQNGDNIINTDDRTVIGTDNPSWIYGFNFNVGYKGFDIGALFQGIGDVQSYGEGEVFVPFNNNAGLASYWLDAWTPQNTDTEIPILATNGGISNNSTNSFFVEDRSYLRLKNLQIGYTFPTDLAGGSIKSLRLFINGQNLWTSTNYRGFDPERAVRDGDGGSGYPQLKIFTGGVNVTF